MTATDQAAEMVSEERISLFNLRTLSIVLVVIGLLISGYLSYTKLASAEILCVEGESFNCDAVQNSIYGEMFGIPVAYLGFLSYLAMLGLLVLQNSISILRTYGIMLTFGLVLFSFAFSMYLVYVQAAIIGTWCSWCLAHEAVMVILMVVTTLRLIKFMRGAPVA